MSEVISSQDFQTRVLEADKPVLVDFFATWCGPCRMIAPAIDEIASEMSDRVSVYRVDIDQSPDIAQQYRVTAVPMLVVFKDGNAVKQMVGAQSKENILEFLDFA